MLCVGDAVLTEWDMERVMEALETRCYDGMQEAMKAVGGFGIEYDENVICDICRDVSSILPHSFHCLITTKSCASHY